LKKYTVRTFITSLGLGWDKLTSITTAGSRNMSGTKANVGRICEQVSQNAA